MATASTRIRIFVVHALHRGGREYMEDFVDVQLREEIGLLEDQSLEQYPGRAWILCREQQGGEGCHCPGLPSHSEGHAGCER